MKIFYEMKKIEGRRRRLIADEVEIETKNGMQKLKLNAEKEV